MADFKKLHAVDIAETASDAAKVLIEENGVIKRVPKDEVGGIKVAAAEVGQTIVVKAVDENGNPTEWEAVDKVKSWNDLEDKPFWEELEPLVSMTITEYYEGTLGRAYPAKTPVELDVVEGESYVVNIDDVLYSCKGMYGNYIGSRHYYIGNGNLHYSSFPGNGDPFVICHCWDDVDGWYYTTWFSDNKPHTITVYKPIVNTLDTQFLPEDLQICDEVTRKPFINETNIVISNNWAEHALKYVGHGFISTEENLVVTFDGQEYEATIRTDGDTVDHIEFYTNEGAYVDITDYRDVYSPNLEGEHTVKVERYYRVLKQFDKKFIPGLPYCVEVYYHGDNEYTCDLSYCNIEDIIYTGTMVYAVIKFESNGKWHVSTSHGYFYFNDYTMPDDDILHFVRPDGRSSLNFYGGGGITYYMGQN